MSHLRINNIRNSTSGNGNIVSVTKHTHRYRFRSPPFQVRFKSVVNPFHISGHQYPSKGVLGVLKQKARDLRASCVYFLISVRIVLLPVP